MKIQFGKGQEWEHNNMITNIYTEEQVNEVAKYTISEWASYNEQKEQDHEKLVKTWLSIELQNFINSFNNINNDRDK